MMASRRTVRTFVSAILLIVSRIGHADEEPSVEEIVRGLARVHLDEGLIAENPDVAVIGPLGPPPLGAPHPPGPSMGPHLGPPPTAPYPTYTSMPPQQGAPPPPPDYSTPYPGGAYPGGGPPPSTEPFSPVGYPPPGYPTADTPVAPPINLSPGGAPPPAGYPPPGYPPSGYPSSGYPGSTCPTGTCGGAMAPQMQAPPEPPHLYQQGQGALDIRAKKPTYARPNCGPDEKYTVNFDNISIIELIRFISTISQTNYIYNRTDLLAADGTPLTITIVSVEETPVEDLSAALLQVLKMNNLSVVEQGNNVLIYRNQNMSKVSTVVTDDNIDVACGNAVITRVFQLYNVDVNNIAKIVRTLVSPEANVEPSPETRHLIVTDITANVHKIADLLQALDTPSLAVDVRELKVMNADPMVMAEYLREILTPLASGTSLSITGEQTSNSIFIVANPFIIAKAEAILGSLDVPNIVSMIPAPPPSVAIENNSFQMYKLKYQNGQEIADALHEIGINLQTTGVGNIDFINTIYSIQWIEVNNSIVITGTDESIQKVVALINELDTLPKQVYIEVLILDTTLTNSLDFGVQWIALGDEQNKLAFGSGLLSNSPPGPAFQAGANAVASGVNPVTGGPPAIPNPGTNLALPVPSNLTDFSGIVNSTAAFGLGIVGNIIRHNGQSFLTLGALLSALDEEEDSSIVLNPKIMVEDGQPADFFVGQNIPYQTTSTVISQTGSVTQNIQYEDIGVQLQITPTIAPDNMVTLQINQSVAEVDGLAGATNLTPVTNKTLATTRVHVPDGTFLVMSGHVRDQTLYLRSGIPCLGTLPCIGPIFSRTVEAREKRNLIFFVRPKVVTSPEGGVKLTNEEGYEYNWETDPCSILECGPPIAPESQVYPIPPELKH